MQQAAQDFSPTASLPVGNHHMYAIKEDMYEYLLVVNPDDAVSKRVKEEKQLFFSLYHDEMSVRTQPHITVANFLAMEYMEETLARWIQRICSQQQSFNVVLNNFSGFPPHTVYLRVQNPHHFQSLAKQLKTIAGYIQGNGMPPAKLITNPHLTVARRLSKEVYQKAIFDYSQKEFFESFVASELLLLRRKPGGKCKVINIFPFLPEISPLMYHTQASLF